jgi:hypothetical protein
MSNKFKLGIIILVVLASVFALSVHQDKQIKMKVNEARYDTIVLVMKSTDNALVNLMVNNPSESSQLLSMVEEFEPKAPFELENKRDAMSKLIRCMKEAIKILSQKVDSHTI